MTRSLLRRVLQPVPPPLRAAAGRIARLAYESATQWSNDRCATMAAAIAFFSAFSLAPTLVLAIAVGGAFFGVDAVEGRLFSEIRDLVGPDIAAAIEATVANAWRSRHAEGTTTLSIVAIALGASATFGELSQALNLIWDVKQPAQSGVLSSLSNMVLVRLTSFALVVGIGFLLAVLLFTDAALSFVLELFRVANPGDVAWLQALQRLLLLTLLALAFAVLLKVLPQRTVPWRHVVPGAITAALMFAGGKHLLDLYLSRAGTANAFGAAGSLAALLMWLYYSAAVFLFGAQVAAATARDEAAGAAAAIGVGGSDPGMPGS